MAPVETAAAMTRDMGCPFTWVAAVLGIGGLLFSSLYLLTLCLIIGVVDSLAHYITRKYEDAGSAR